MLPSTNASIEIPEWGERFWSKVDVYGMADCWPWNAAINTEGYGVFRLDGRMQKAHRLAYEMLVASIPWGLVLDHTCRTRHCVNPAHLEPVSSGENTRRGDRVTDDPRPGTISDRKATLKPRFLLRLDDTTYDVLRDYAHREHVHMTVVIREAIRQYLKDRL